MSPRPDQMEALLDLVHRTNQAIHRVARARVPLDDLTLPQIAVLRMLASQGPMRLVDVARELQQTPSTVSGIVERLERMGLVSRTRSPRDRREIYLSATPSGKERIAQKVAALNALIAELFADYPEQELAALLSALSSVLRHLERREGKALESKARQVSSHEEGSAP